MEFIFNPEWVLLHEKIISHKINNYCYKTERCQHIEQRFSFAKRKKTIEYENERQYKERKKMAEINKDKQDNEDYYI